MSSRRPESRETDGRDSFDRAWHERFLEFASLRDDDAGIAGWSTSGLETRLRFFRNRWRTSQPGALYLDAGCGAGTYTRWLAEQGVHPIGVDYSLPTLVKARDRSAAGLSFCAADALRLPFRDKTFDGALCFGLLQAVSNSAPVARELARVLKPGGTLWIDALNQGGLAARVASARRRARGQPMHLRYESPRVLSRIMADAGFDDLTLHWLPIVPARMRLLQPVVESRVARYVFAHVPPVGGALSHAFVIRAMRASR